MRLGQLTNPVTIKRATAVRDDYGHDALTYSDVYSPLMVHVVEDSQSVVDDDADGRSRRAVARFTASWTSDLDIQQRDQVVWDGDTWEVETFFNLRGQNKFVEFTAVRLERE